MSKEHLTVTGNTDAPAKPLAPLWIFKIANALVKALLRSPLHGMLSGSLLLLTYQGRSSGKQYTIPIGYFPWAKGAVISFTSARWFVNVRDGRPVTLLIKGKPVAAVATVIEERGELLATLAEFVKRLGPATAHRLPLGLPADRPPTAAELAAVPGGVAFIVFNLTNNTKR